MPDRLDKSARLIAETEARILVPSFWGVGACASAKRQYKALCSASNSISGADASFGKSV